MAVVTAAFFRLRLLRSERLLEVAHWHQIGRPTAKLQPLACLRSFLPPLLSGASQGPCMNRNGYLTVGDLLRLLQGYDPDALVMLHCDDFVYCGTLRSEAIRAGTVVSLSLDGTLHDRWEESDALSEPGPDAGCSENFPAVFIDMSIS